MDQENTTPTNVVLLRDIPYFAKAGDVLDVPQYLAALWIANGAARDNTIVDTTNQESA